MKLKINRYEFDATDKDWILDNVKWIYDEYYNVKVQFKQLVKENKLVQFTNERLEENYLNCKFYRFNFDDKTKQEVMKI